MRLPRVLLPLAALALLSGCGYVHFGRLPQQQPMGAATASEAYTNLETEYKVLKQELAIERKESDALRAALERANGKGTSATELTAQLESTTRELAALRANYAKLQAARTGSADAATLADLKAQLSDTSGKLAEATRTSTQLQEDNTRLRSDLDRLRAENSTLADQLRAAAARNDSNQLALAQLNAELLAAKDQRTRAEQANLALRTQLSAVVATREAQSPTQPAPRAKDDAGTTDRLDPLRLAKAPPAGASPTAELRTSPERLRAPAANATGPAMRSYTVQEGDTLERIAQKYYGAPDQWRRIYDANAAKLSAGQPLRPGMELDIPE